MSQQSFNVNYSGFVYVDTPLSVPSRDEARTVHDMFKKKNLKKTRAIHTLWARGLPNKLTLNVSETGLSLTERNCVVLEFPIQKIFYSTRIDSSLFVFVRRSGFESSFKCHVFVFASEKDSEIASEVLVRLASILGFRRQSMSMVPRASSVASLDFLPPGYESPLSSRSTSRVNSDGEDSDVPDSRKDSPVHHPQVAESTNLPCGICHKNNGDNWIALKTCGHQHHLSCIGTWRAEHNLCPSCNIPISLTSFSLQYVGGCFSEGKVSAPEVRILGADLKSFSTEMDILRVNVTNSQLNFLNRLGSVTTEVKSCNQLTDVRDVMLIDSLIVIVIADGSGFLVQIFEPKHAAEAGSVYAALKTACSKS